MGRERKRSRPVLLKILIIITILLLGWLILIKLFSRFFDYPIFSVSSSVHPIDAGDCAAVGSRRPRWALRPEILKELPNFDKLYQNRPFKVNDGGMRYDHSFALWYMLRSVHPRPSFVIESGSRRGHTTWLIRQSLPEAKIFSLSPSTPSIEVKNTIYMHGKNFTDFKSVRWSRLKVNPSKTVVLLDDHQSADQRIFQQGKKFGFRKFIYDDNYAYPEGDNLSMKWLCEVKRSSEWPGHVRRNFNAIQEKQTWGEHMKQAEMLRRLVKAYYEFPPIITSRKYSAPPLLDNLSSFYNIIGNDQEYSDSELSSYCNICYVELL